jgi:hypothetical protein
MHSHPVRAFLLAPLAAPAAYAACIVLAELFSARSLPSLRSLGVLVLGVFALGGTLAYVALLAVGGPLYLLLRRFGLVARSTLWPAGAVVGSTVALLLAPSLKGDLFSIRFHWWAGALLGVLSAEVFLRLLGSDDRGVMPGATSE